MTNIDELQALTLPDADAHKVNVSAVFDTLSAGYDDPALRFFPFCANQMVTQLSPAKGWKVLDVATGTGALAGALAQVISPGRVTAIDLSEGMLARARQKIEMMALENIDFFLMDAEAPEFNNEYFDAVTCSFGLFFIPDMLKALRQWKRITRSGGTVLFSSFTENAFQPLLDIFIEDLKKYGVDVEQQTMSSSRLKEARVCKALMEQAGFGEVRQTVIQAGYYLRDVEEWWTAIWFTAMRRLVEKIDPERVEDFKARHLERIADLRTDEGIWMDVEVRLTSGTVTQI